MTAFLSSARTCHQHHRKSQRKRVRMVSWRSRRCWCSTWKTQKPSPYRSREQSLLSTPCCTGRPLQVDGHIHYTANWFILGDFLNLNNNKIFKKLCIFSGIFFLSLVVQEAVQFCVTVCEFSVANSVSGVRKMLPLVWSTDAAVKDAVIQAYRRLYLNPQGDSVRSVKPYIYLIYKSVTRSFISQV